MFLKLWDAIKLQSLSSIVKLYFLNINKVISPQNNLVILPGLPAVL